MIAKAYDKLETAKIDLDHNKYDDSASRSYYAVFHAISAALESKDLSFSSHSQAIGAFNKEFVKQGIFPKSFTRNIQDLFDYRQSGDYDIRSDVDEIKATRCINLANEIVGTIQSYLEDIMN